MALTVSSPRVFNGNVGKQGFQSDSTGSKCLCCPYGYHIDLDFVRYCEAVAADTTSDNKSTIERRKKRERRRQCQSMEILLGLVDPVLEGLENQSPEIAQDNLTGNGITTLPRSCHTRPSNIQHTPALDLSDVVGDFEATLRRLSKPSKSSERKIQHEVDGINPPASIQINQHTELATDFDNASIGSGNSNLSTGALQSIREQMAVSLERMRELEEQVKAIPMLQVQVSVLKEEKRNLQRQVEELNESKINNEQDSSIYRSNSFSLKRRNNENTPKIPAISTRDMGIMCGVMTRDVGVSHQQVRTRDVGMITSTPLARGVGMKDRTSLNDSSFDEEDITNYLDITSKPRTTSRYELEDMRIERMMPCYPKGPISLASLNGTGSPNTRRKNVQNLRQSPIKCETILPDVCSYKDRSKSTYESRKDSSTNTEKSSPTSLQRSALRFDEILPRQEEVVIVRKPAETRNIGTETILRMRDIHSPDDIARIVEDALRIYQESIQTEKASKYTQCVPEVTKLPDKKDQQVQVSEAFKMKMNVGTTCKPRTMEAGTDVGPLPGTRTIATGPDPVATTNVISLNSMNSLRSHSFNYGDTRPKRKTTKSVASLTEDLIKTAARSTETTDLQPKKRDFGTSPFKKIFVDVSVGDSLKPHIAISCAANYCDNCKETIKNLAKQMSNSSEIHCNNQNSPIVSRIPRPSHINLGSSPDHRRQFKRQDTYTKIPASGVIRYDTDNRDHYETNNRLQQQQETEEIRNEKKEPKETGLPEKEIELSDEKNVLSDSGMFQPINDKPREKVEPSKEMRAAMKVLNDNLKKSPSKNLSNQTKNAANVIQQEWFKISSTAAANPLDVEDYLDCFEEFSSQILEYIVNMTDSSGNTAMHYAVSHGNFDVVSILLDSKVCDINKANVAGYTAVMLAALADLRNSTHASVANRLFQLADVNIRAKLHGQTALMLAVSHGRKDMTRLLLDAGAAVNIQDEDGSTALMCAAEHGYTDIVRLLLAHPDCDSSIMDVDGSSALKIALEAGNRDIGVLLYAHEHVNRGTSPYSSMRRSRRGSKPTTPTGPSPSAPVSPAPSRRFNSSTISLNSTKYSGKQ